MSKMKNLLNARHREHAEHQDGSIARAGTVPKKSNDGAPVHPNMTRAQKDGAGFGGMGHAVAVIDGGQNSLTHAYGSAADLKTGKPAPDSVVGQRSRTNSDTETLADKVQAGRDCLAQAVKN